MRHGRIVLGLILTAAAAIAAGCNHRPAPPSFSGPVVASGEAENTAVRALTNARAEYEYRLMVLQAYYDKIGSVYKKGWADHELKNLLEAQKYLVFKGVEAAAVPEAPPLNQVDDFTLVEAVVGARTTYLESLDHLAAFYKAHGPPQKAALARNARDRFDPIRTYMYFLPAEVPGAESKPLKVYAEAEKLYADGLKLYQDGKILPAVVDYGKERQALVKLLELVHKYPDSTRIAYAAYYIGDIYKEYFDEDYRAVLWYERAAQWDPTITKPARFQAAVVYDHRLHHRGKALELYREAVKYEPMHDTNTDYARKRIEELSRLPSQP